jgi:hypothetical protein
VFLPSFATTSSFGRFLFCNFFLTEKTRYESRKKKKNFIYVLGYLLELYHKIWRFGCIFLRNLASLGLVFFDEKTFESVEIIFSGRNWAKISPVKRTPASR